MQRIGAQAEIDKLVSGFFSVFDNRNGVVPELASLLGYFAEKAVIARSSGLEIQLYTAMGFALPRIELLSGGRLVDFHEAEISSSTTIFGGIAIRTSRYRKAGMLNGSAYAGVGTKSFQLVSLLTGWRIASLAWADDEA
ncbi:MAG: hypothetical protein ACJ8GK_05565 [Luteimonas sp.]